MDSTADTVSTEALFRPAKKRKFARRRADPETEDAADADPALVASDQNDNAAPTQPSYKNSRRPRIMRKGGIGFSAKSQLGHGHGQQLALAPTAGDPEEDKIRAMNERFTGYTGQSDDVDRHMYEAPLAIKIGSCVGWTNKIRMEYIDSEMAKRYQPHAQVPNPDIAQPTSKEVTANLSFHGQQQQREPASLGKLHEIDLGQEATLRNIARTEAATRRLAGDEDLPSGDADIVSGASRSAPGGKSRRARQQRTDADIERDRLVEEVLRESKLDVYDEYEDDSRPDDPQAADDRIAEQFRRDFMDAMQSRRRLRATKPVAKDEGPKGPKLGGSRSARAAMRETQTGKK
ncbi:unnamed protein product [Penicillium salamii]|nr:unnamed protein product [Penicillium salamii]